VFEKVKAEYDARAGATRPEPASPTSISPATTCWSRSARRRFSWIERDIGIEFDKWGHAKSTLRPWPRPTRGVLGGDSAFGPKNIIWAVAHGHEAALSIGQALLRH